MKPLIPKLFTLAPVLIIIAGMVVRLININQPLLEFFPQRQTQTAEITRNIYKNGWPDFWTPKVRYFTPPRAGQAGEPIPYVLEFPLYNGIIAFLYHLFGPAVIWGRMTSLTFFILSSIIFYRLTKSSIIRHPSSIYALLFFVFSPLHILTSRSFQPEELALFLLLLSIYKKSWLIFSLAVLTKLPLALFTPAMLYASSRAQPRDPASKASDIIKCGLSLAPSLIWYLRASMLTVHPAIARNFDISNWFQPYLWLDPKWYFSLFQIEHIWVLTTLGLLFFWLGLHKIITKEGQRAGREVPDRTGVDSGSATVELARADDSSRPAFFWLVWLLSGLFYLAIFNYHAMTHEYYHLFLLPPLSVIAGLGLSSILSNISKHWSKPVATAGIIIMVIVSLSQPAIRKILSAPKSPEESTEITPARYRLVEDFN